MSSQNILDWDVPKSDNTPLLIPKKYIKEKTPSPSFYQKLKKQVLKTFDKFQKNVGDQQNYMKVVGMES